ncbi:MAG: hypothetical protein ACLR0N_13255 [Bilophila wadsworthia]
MAPALDAECLQRAAHDPDARIRRADHDRLQIHEGIAAEHFHLFLKRQPYGERERASLPDSDSTQISPPMFSTIYRAMLRPSPVPPCRRVSEESACLNGWNSCGS